MVWATNYYSLPLHMLYGSNIYTRGSYSGYYITPDIWQYYTLVTLLYLVRGLTNKYKR